MKKRIKQTLTIMMMLIFLAGIGCEQLGLGKKDDDNDMWLLLLGLAWLNQPAPTSGFFVTIPYGVAK